MADPSALGPDDPTPPMGTPLPVAAVVLVLVHSPLVGPDTWAPVAEELRAQGCPVVVPRLSDSGTSPFWEDHVDSVTSAVGEPDPAATLALVLHSGAGQLADLLVAALDRDGHVVEAVVHVDAGLPTGGISRLGQLAAEEPDLAADLEALLDEGGTFPGWTDAQMRPLVPDGARRRRLLDGVTPKGAAYWREHLPAATTPAHHRGVVLLSAGYAATAATARDRGWPVRDLAADNHFLALRDPGSVADAVLEVLDELLGGPGGSHPGGVPR